MGFGFALFWTVALYFQDKTVGLIPYQMVLLGTVSECVIFLCEIPTGVVADVVSRRLSVILGFLIIGVGLAIQPIFPTLVGLIVGMSMWGLGETFISGAFDAWIADELPFDAPELTPGQVYLQGAQWSQAGSLIGVWISVLVATRSLGAPLAMAGCVFVAMGLWMIWRMPERGFHRAGDEERLTWGRFRQTMFDGVRAAWRIPAVLFALLVVTLIGLGSEVFDRLWTKHLTLLGFPSFGFPEVIWLAVISSLATLGTIFLTRSVRQRRLEDDMPRLIRTVQALVFILAIATLVMAVSGQFWLAAAAMILGKVMRRTVDPLMSAWINAHAEPSLRATMLSLKGQSHGLGELFGGPLLGGVAQAFGVAAALVASAGVNGLAWLAAWRAGRVK